MKQLNTRFIISNLITAVLLFLSVPYYRAHFHAFQQRNSAPLYGFIIILAAIIGMISMSVKSYDLAYHSKNKIQWHGKVFLVITYLGAFISNIFLIIKAESFTHEEPRATLLILFLLVAGFIALILESHFLSERPKKMLPKHWIRLADRGSMIYSSVGIGLCWNHFVIGSNIH